MELEYKSELHNYALLELNEKEVEIVNYIIDNDPDFKAELYKRDGLYFLFNENKKMKVQELTDYLFYVVDSKQLKLLIRKQKIERFTEGS